MGGKKSVKRQYDMEAVPYMDFMNHFKQIKVWTPVLSDANSPLLKLLTKGDLFFKRKIIAFEKSRPSTSNSVYSKNAQKVVNFEKDRSLITTVGKDGSSKTIQFYVDVMNLRLLALVLCKGSIEEKANVFFDTVIGMEKVKRQRLENEYAEEPNVSWRQRRLVASFKMLMYISEVMPKKY